MNRSRAEIQYRIRGGWRHVKVVPIIERGHENQGTEREDAPLYLPCDIPHGLIYRYASHKKRVDTRLNKIIGLGHITRKVWHPALLVGMFQYALQEKTKEQTAFPSFSCQ
jgi:hypothetical protein